MHKHTFEQDSYSLFINLSVCMVKGNIPHEFLNVLLFGLDFFFQSVPAWAKFMKSIRMRMASFI